MAWVESHQELGQHPKTLKAAKKLGINVPQMVGHLHLLWHWALSYADDGDLSKWDDDDVALGAQWDGDSGEFVRALAGVGFIDEADGSRLLHDWMDYAGRLVRERERKRAARSKPQDTDPPPDSTTSDDEPHTDDGESAERPQTGGGQEADDPRAGTNPTQPTNQPDQPVACADEEPEAPPDILSDDVPRQPEPGKTYAQTLDAWLDSKDRWITPRSKVSDEYRALLDTACEFIGDRTQLTATVAEQLIRDLSIRLTDHDLPDDELSRLRTALRNRKPVGGVLSSLATAMENDAGKGEYANKPGALMAYALACLDGRGNRKAAS